MLNPLIWSASLSVGNEYIDNQHKQLIALCDRATQCANVQSREAKEEFHLVLNDLVMLANEHFGAEEKLLAENNCPTLLDHKLEHEACREELTNLLFKGMTGRFDIDGLVKLVQQWVNQHKLKSDMENRSFMQNSQ